MTAVKSEVRERCLICGGTGRTYGNSTVESATDCWKCCGSGYYPLLEETQGQVNEAAIGDNPEVLPCHVCGALGALAEVATEDKFVWACPACAETIAASLKAKAEAAVCPACNGNDGTPHDGTCFYCEGTGIEPEEFRKVRAQVTADLEDIEARGGIAAAVLRGELKELRAGVSEKSRKELIDDTQARIIALYEIDQQIIGKVDALDEVRRRMKAVTNGLIVMGVTGKNEKERDAGLAKLLAEETEYPDLMQQERQLHTELKQLESVKDYLRRMHHLDLALIQGDRP